MWASEPLKGIVTMTLNKVFGVLLTDEGWNDLAGVIDPYASEGPIGKYIYCQNIYPDGSYFVMLTTCKNQDSSSFDAEISIPHQYVKFFVSASDKSQIGFMQ
jgi:hypothetical protein